MSTRAFFNIIGPLKDNETLVGNITATLIIHDDSFANEQLFLNSSFGEAESGTHNSSLVDNDIFNGTSSDSLNATHVLDDDAWWRELSSLSDSQEITLSMLQLLSGTLSILGSSIIIYQVWNSPKHRRVSYGRILLGLSLADVVASSSFAIAPFLLPQATSQRIMARGNDATCSFLGFWTQLAYLAPWYNGILGLYYYMTIRRGVSRAVFAKKYEKWIHIFSWSFFLFSACLGSVIGIYSESELGHGCWVGEYPAGCEARNDCTGQYFGWIFAALPTCIVFISLPFMNLSIYRHVRATLRKNERYAPDSTSLQHLQNSRAKQTQKIASQAFFYVGSYYLSYTPTMIIRVIEGMSFDAYQEHRIFPLLVLAACLSPLQGFFNVFVFVKPNYYYVRRTVPDQSRLWAIIQCLKEPDVQTFAVKYTSVQPSSRFSHQNQRASRISSANYSWQLSTPDASIQADNPRSETPNRSKQKSVAFDVGPDPEAACPVRAKSNVAGSVQSNVTGSIQDLDHSNPFLVEDQEHRESRNRFVSKAVLLPEENPMDLESSDPGQEDGLDNQIIVLKDKGGMDERDDNVHVPALDEEAVTSLVARADLFSNEEQSVTNESLP